MEESSGFNQVTTLTKGLTQSRQRSPYALPQFARIYDRVISDVTHGASGRKLLDEVNAFVPHGGRVLEVGAGTGKDALALARSREDVQVVGTDPSEPMLDRARMTPDQPRNIDWLQAAAAELPFEDQSFDAVYSANALKHFESPVEELGEMMRVLRPGGLLLVAEVSPYVGLRSTWQVAKKVRLPFFLRPFLAFKLRGETSKLLPPRDRVESWFRAQSLAESFDGLDHGADELPAAFFVARLRRQTAPVGNS